MTIGSLFSGIGGLELGLERAGLGPVVWQVEPDEFCRRILHKHWPTVERHDDVRRVKHLPRVDVICGGFPCQDVSTAGKQAGLAGKRSGLWFEFRRIVEETRPRFVVVENVAQGKAAWLSTVRRDLCDLGYRSRAFGLSAADVGSSQLRRRVFVVADADGERVRDGAERVSGRWTGDVRAEGQAEPLDASKGVGHDFPPLLGDDERWVEWDGPQPGIRGVADGVPAWLDGARPERLRCLGNAVVPQCAEVIGRIVVEMMAGDA